MKSQSQLKVNNIQGVRNIFFQSDILFIWANIFGNWAIYLQLAWEAVATYGKQNIVYKQKQ